jgi:hypothetical protein
VLHEGKGMFAPLPVFRSHRERAQGGQLQRFPVLAGRQHDVEGAEAVGEGILGRLAVKQAPEQEPGK